MTDSSAAPRLLVTALRQDELFPIREVCRLTGVNPVTLRAWERRYGLIQPTRTESGHRLYSMADIEAVRSILAWIDRGVAVSKVGQILAKSQTAREQASSRDDEQGLGEWQQWQLQLRQAVAAFDEERLERLYGQVFSSYPLAVAFQDVLLPVWRELRGRQGEFGLTSEWLFLDAFLRARVLQRLQLARAQVSARVLLVAMPGECQELELLSAGLFLGSPELAVSVLALGQPLQELPLLCDKVQPRALVLYSSHAPGSELMRQLKRLSQGLTTPLALAGEAADLARDSLAGSPIACLGSDAPLMRRRLQQFLAGHLDT